MAADKKDRPVKGKLVSYVYVTNDRGAAEVFGPDDAVPQWAAEKMGAHCWEGGEHPSSGEAEKSGPPPKSGRGSSLEAWQEYAAAHDVDVESAQNRDDVVAALDQAGVPTE